MFKTKKENKAINDRIIRHTKNFFEYERENYFKLVRVGNFWSNNYIDYESNGDKIKTIS